MVATPTPNVPESTIRLHTPNGKGSTNTGVVRWTTVEYSAGALGVAGVYVDSGTLGGYITIPKSAYYDCQGEFADSSAAANAGVTINSSSLTVGYFGVSASEKWGGTTTPSATNNAFSFSGNIRWLNAGDVIRVQGIGSNASAASRFSLTEKGV